MASPTFEIVYKTGTFQKSVAKFDIDKYSVNIDDFGVYVYRDKGNKMVFAIFKKDLIRIRKSDND